jgi:hypothetical protein
MRIILFFLVFAIVTRSYAQDPDYTDFRRKTESFSRLYDKNLRSDLACFAIGGLDESLGKPTLNKLPVTAYGFNFISFDSNHIQVTIRSSVFVAAKHKLQYDGKHLVRIDNKPYYGDYGKLPPSAIAAVTVVVDHDTVAIPSSAFQDLFNPSFTYKDPSGALMSQDAVYISGDKHTFYVYMLNRDDSGSYEVTWVIQDKKYLRRVLDWGFSN